MKNLRTFDEFLNEAQLNEMRDPSLYYILPLGSMNINTGKSKYFNVYETWTEDDCTAEIYEEVEPKAGTMRIVFTQGKTPINNRNGKAPAEGDTRGFGNNENYRFMFGAKFVTSCLLKDLKDVCRKLGIKSAPAYTYK